jgi:hypothetical protein
VHFAGLSAEIGRPASNQPEIAPITNPKGSIGARQDEAMERTEFLRRQADRFLRLARECTDPEIRRQLVSMAYRTMLEVPDVDRQANLGKAS